MSLFEKRRNVAESFNYLPQLLLALMSINNIWPVFILLSTMLMEHANKM